jgi:murein DD-endopeptidase MepM/ murein hydrolase activator NlpD
VRKRTTAGLISRKIRFFVFSDASMGFREVRLFRVKVIASGLSIGLAALGFVLLMNYLSGDLLGLGYDRMSFLSTENRVLKEQIRDLSQRMETIQQAIDRLANRGNELRLLVDLHRIDDDTKEAAIGGAHPATTNPFLSGEASDIMDRSQNLIDRLAREVKLQQSSYEDIYRKFEYNKMYFSHLPAIKPMVGAYSVKGFGMRVHPVLRVYRMHEGIDIIGDVGTNIYAAADGQVHFSGRTQGGYGIVVEVTHGYGYSTLYAHLSKVFVRPGQNVKRGELIAKCGRSGLVSGPHLHYEVRLAGRKQNPVDYFFDDVDAARYRVQLASIKKSKGEQ